MKAAINNEAHWHELRAKNIGASEVAALFGRSAFTTPWQLWHEKAGKLSVPFDETYTKAGVHFEAGIAAWAVEKWGMKLHKVQEYHSDPETTGMGASLDYATDTGEPVEIKFNHYAGEDWRFENGELVEVPEQYIWQVQHQLACHGGEKGWLVAFVRGDIHRLSIRRSERIIASIRAKVAAFWRSIEADEPPPVDLQRDDESLAHLLFQRSVKSLDLAEHETKFADYARIDAEAKTLTKQAKELKAELLALVEEQTRGINEPVDKAIVTSGKHRMTLTRVEDNLGTEVTPDMVGTRIGARRGHLRATFSVAKSDD